MKEEGTPIYGSPFKVSPCCGKPCTLAAILESMKTLNLFILFTISFSTMECKLGKSSKAYSLTVNERTICDTLQIDTTIVHDIRRFNSIEIEPFHYSLGRSTTNGIETEIDPIHLQGLLVKEENSKSYDLIFKLKDKLAIKGFSIFMLEKNFNIDHKLDRIGVLKTMDKYSILKHLETSGPNYDITNDSLISIIKGFDNKYSLDLVGASGDYCEFIIQRGPQDWNILAEEVYKVCPDVVDQGTGTVQALAEEMKKSKRLYFWWD